VSIRNNSKLEILREKNARWREHFGALKLIHKGTGLPWVFFDNAATSLRPKSVIEKIAYYYEQMPVNIHRSIHALGEAATQIYEDTRTQVQKWIGAENRVEIIFTRGTTEGANLVANSYARKFLKSGDIILVTESDHHSNIVPWQLSTQDSGAELLALKLKPNGSIDWERFISETPSSVMARIKLFAFPAISNTFGMLNPIAEMVQFCKSRGIVTFVDAAQAAPHQLINIANWGRPDFIAFSGHKLYAPTGIGVLYGREELLNAMPPFMGGGDMIDQVSIEQTTYNALPYKFEAGTPSIAEVFGLGAALTFLEQIDKNDLQAWEEHLAALMMDVFAEFPQIKILGDINSKSIPLFSFYSKEFHSHDIAQLMSQIGVAIRSGHLCAQPLLKSLGVTSVARASLAFYNNESDVERFKIALNKSLSILKPI
jgi:cysteine desulfurase/selenocysteine lyase